MQFHERTCAYKTGVVFCVFAIVSCLVAISMPTWKEGSNGISGLFQNCGKLFEFSSCDLIHSYTHGAWFEIVRGLELISVLFLIFDVIFQCKRKPSRYEGVDAFFIGLFMAAGPAVYGYFFHLSSFGNGAMLSWGYILACVGPGLAIVGSFCMCGSEYTTSNQVEPISIKSKEKRRREKKQQLSPKAWEQFPDQGSYVENDYHRDYGSKNHDPYDDFLHRY